MKTSKDMITGLRYLNEEVNRLYRLVEQQEIKGLSEHDLDVIKRTVDTLKNNFDYIISDRYKGKE